MLADVSQVASDAIISSSLAGKCRRRVCLCGQGQFSSAHYKAAAWLVDIFKVLGMTANEIIVTEGRCKRLRAPLDTPKIGSVNVPEALQPATVFEDIAT